MTNSMAESQDLSGTWNRLAAPLLEHKNIESNSRAKNVNVNVDVDHLDDDDKKDNNINMPPKCWVRPLDQLPVVDLLPPEDSEDEVNEFAGMAERVSASSITCILGEAAREEARQEAQIELARHCVD
ncbi:unnamed protein product, partial [Amoebophrya sp. A25]|eukprot:GSA25T00009222001.1